MNYLDCEASRPLAIKITELIFDQSDKEPSDQGYIAIMGALHMVTAVFDKRCKDRGLVYFIKELDNKEIL